MNPEKVLFCMLMFENNLGYNMTFVSEVLDHKGLRRSFVDKPF